MNCTVAKAKHSSSFSFIVFLVVLVLLTAVTMCDKVYLNNLPEDDESIVKVCVCVVYMRLLLYSL
jgi:hypothetical protein